MHLKLSARVFRAFLFASLFFEIRCLKHRFLKPLELVLLLMFFAGSFSQVTHAETMDWATYGANTNILSPAAPSTSTPNIITVTSSAVGAGITTARTVDILPGTTVNTHLGIVQSTMNATTDILSVSNTITFGFSSPVYNLCFTVVDIDGSPTASSGGSTFNDQVQFGPVPSSAPTIGSNVGYNALTGLASTNGAYVADTTGDIRVCYAGPISTVTVQLIAAGAAGTDPTLQNIAVDDLTYDTPPTVTISKVSNGGVGTFGFTGDNGFTAHNVTTVTAGVAVTGPRRILSLPSTATILTEGAPPAGFALIGITCAGLGAGGTATNNLAARTVTFNAAATALNSNITCTFTNTRATVKVQKLSTGGVGGPFAFAKTNLDATPADITTTTAGVAAPVAPASINVTTIGTAVTLTETPLTGYAVTAASCTDANSAVTGNTGLRGTLAGNVLTIPAADVKAGVDFTCTFTNARTSVKVQKITLGGVGGPFAFAKTNLDATPADITTTTAGVAAPVSPAAINITTLGTAITITETPIAGYALTAASCTDANSAVTGNTGLRGTFSGNVLTIPAADVKAGVDFTCTFTNTRATIMVQKITTGGVDGPFTFADTNITGALPSITTTSVGVAAPAAPTASNVTTVGSAVTITETVVAGYTLISASCTDANSAVTGNTGARGTLAGNVLTIPAADVDPGTDYTCVFTNRKIPTVKVQKTTLGGVGGPFTFADTNITGTVANITTVAAGTPTPAAPAANVVTTVGTAVTLTETPIAGYALTAASCTDANSAIAVAVLSISPSPPPLLLISPACTT